MDREQAMKAFNLSEETAESLERNGIDLTSVVIYRTGLGEEDYYGRTVIHTVCLLRNISGRWCRGVTRKSLYDTHNKKMSRTKAFWRAATAAINRRNNEEACTFFLDSNEVCINEVCQSGYDVGYNLSDREIRILDNQDPALREEFSAF